LFIFLSSLASSMAQFGSGTGSYGTIGGTSVTNGLTGNSNNFYGTFGTIVQPVYSTTTSFTVSGITNVTGISEALSHYNGTYYWSNGLPSQGLWVKGNTNFFGYFGDGFAGPCFTTNISSGAASFIGDYNGTWTPFSGSLFSSSVGVKTFTFQNSGGSPDTETATFTLPISTAAATNLFTPTAISLMAASGNTNLLISNNDPWFTTDKNPTLDVSGSVDQALVVKGSFYVTGTLNGNGGGLTNISGASGGGATNLLNVRLYPYTQATNISISLPSSATNISQLTYAILATNNIYFVQPSNLVAGFSFLIDWRQDSTGGRTATWNTNFWKFPSAQILTMTTNANSASLISCVVGQYATNVFVIQSLNFQ